MEGVRQWCPTAVVGPVRAAVGPFSRSQSFQFLLALALVRSLPLTAPPTGYVVAVVVVVVVVVAVVVLVLVCGLVESVLSE